MTLLFASLAGYKYNNVTLNSGPLAQAMTSGSAIAEGPRDVLVSRNSAATKYRYRVALFA